MGRVPSRPVVGHSERLAALDVGSLRDSAGGECLVRWGARNSEWRERRRAWSYVYPVYEVCAVYPVVSTVVVDVGGGDMGKIRRRLSAVLV